MAQIILITGALGYLGSRIAKAISNSGREVVLGVSYHNTSLVPLELNHLEVRRYDLSSIESCIILCKDIDIVIHTSGLNSENCYSNPNKALVVNCLYTSNLLEGIKFHNISKVFYFSTAHVYSNVMSGYFSEETFPRNPHPYATSHLCAEQQLAWFGKQHNVNVISLRLSNCFGKELVFNSNCWSLFVNDICKQAVKNKEIIIRSNPSIQRNFLPITELENIILFLINSNFIGVELINVGNYFSLTLTEMVNIVNYRIFNQLNYIPKNLYLYNGDITLEKLDFSIDKLLNLGYSFTQSIEEEIDEIINYIHNG